MRTYELRFFDRDGERIDRRIVQCFRIGQAHSQASLIRAQSKRLVAWYDIEEI
jgi:hypothetical protein